MRFDTKKMEKCYEAGDLKNVAGWAYTLEVLSEYADENEVSELIDMLNVMLDMVYDIEDRDVQESLFDSIRFGYAMNIRYSQLGLNRIIERIIEKIDTGELDDYELGESILIVSESEDPQYMDFMLSFVDSENNYIRETVEEYIQDLKYAHKI